MARADHTEIATQIRTFGNNLRRMRQDVGLTQAELSFAAPLDRAAISRLECGERTPDLSTLLRVCTALGVKPTVLLRGVGPKTPPYRAYRQNEPQMDGDAAKLFGANLKWARAQAGISQERLALEAKVDRAAISVYENGSREPNLRTVLKLALKLKVQPALLLEGIQ